MIIRSQDKRTIIPLNQPIYVEMVIDKWKVSTESFFLGEYSTKEKAIKVLDMICKAYENYRGGNVYEYSIFNMPSDEEVEV